MRRGRDGRPKRVVMRFDGGAGSCLDRSAWGWRLSWGQGWPAIGVARRSEGP